MSREIRQSEIPNIKNEFYICRVLPYRRIFDLMKEEELLLAYSGEITTDLTEAIAGLLETKTANAASSMKKKFYFLLTECIQNMVQHSHDRTDSFLAISKENERLNIVTGNMVTEKDANHLKQQINLMNEMSQENLKQHYLETLANKGFSEKGGAGLGLIEMARKSQHPLQYEFESLPDGKIFFLLKVIAG